MAVVTSKGQITIPAEVREALGLRTGSTVEFVPTDRGTNELVPTTVGIMDLAGRFRYDGPPKTIEEMNEAVRAGPPGSVMIGAMTFDRGAAKRAGMTLIE